MDMANLASIEPQKYTTKHVGCNLHGYHDPIYSKLSVNRPLVHKNLKYQISMLGLKLNPIS